MSLEKHTKSTSIFAFQETESLAGFATKYGAATDEEFAAKCPDPVLLTSMPTDANLTVWSVVIAVRKKTAKGGAEDSISRSARALWDEMQSRTKIYVGRAPDSDIVVAPKSVSRKHCCFERKADGWYVSDLHSSNGTRLEGELLAPNTAVLIRTSPVKLELGSATPLWFMLPADFLAYLRCFTQHIADTSKTRLPAVNPKHDRNKTPVENSLIASLDKLQSPEKPAPKHVARAEAETNPLIREGHFESTWHDDDEVDANETMAGGLPVGSRRTDPDMRLVDTIRAVAALDSLILSVSVTFKAEKRSMTIYSSQVEGKVTDVADQLVRLGPLLRSVTVTLSVGDGGPVEIYSVEPKQRGASREG